MRVGRGRWFNLLWLLPIGFVLLLVAVAVAKGLRDDAVGAALHPPLPRDACSRPHPDQTTGFPALGALAALLQPVLHDLHRPRPGSRSSPTIRGCTGRGTPRPGRDWFRIQKPVPADPLWTAKQDSISLPGQVGLPGLRHSIGLARWWHLGIDVLWLLNGVIFFVLLFATGRWERLVPTSWDVFPNALSVLIQYLSLNWPAENGWAAYNGLQLIAYFITVFVAAPLALITGLGMSPALSTRFQAGQQGLQHPDRPLAALPGARLVPGLHRPARHVRVHHRPAGQPQPRLRRTQPTAAGSGSGCSPRRWSSSSSAGSPPRRSRLRHPRVVQRVGQALVGPLQHLFEHVDPQARANTPRRTSRRTSGTTASTPTPTSTRRSSTAASPTTGCGSTAWSSTPSSSTSPSCGRCPITSRSPSTSASRAGQASRNGAASRCGPSSTSSSPQPEAKWVVFYSLGDGADKGIYYDAHPIEHMSHHLTMLAYDMNDEPLTFGHGAPLRLRNEIELGFKQVKWIKGIEFVAHYSEVGGGYGGYNQDHEFFGYRQSI